MQTMVEDPGFVGGGGGWRTDSQFETECRKLRLDRVCVVCVCVRVCVRACVSACVCSACVCAIKTVQKK